MSVVRPYRRLCLEADLRDSMANEQFWQHVSKNVTGVDPDPDGDAWPESVVGYGEPCSWCGEPGACAYDSEGRPMIHATPNAEVPS